MNLRLAPLAEILRLNTRLLRNCLDGMSEAQAGARPSGATNSAAFVAAHVADARFFLLSVIGAPRPSPLAAYLEGARGIEDLERCPPLAEILAAWAEASDALSERLAAVTDAELDAPSPSRFPVDDRTVLGAVAFLVQHDSYHVGQLALLRKHAGLPAMRYG
jgi:uncharacterized damage-inducible protein DinB